MYNWSHTLSADLSFGYRRSCLRSKGGRQALYRACIGYLYEKLLVIIEISSRGRPWRHK